MNHKLWQELKKQIKENPETFIMSSKIKTKDSMIKGDFEGQLGIYLAKKDGVELHQAFIYENIKQKYKKESYRKLFLEKLQITEEIRDDLTWMNWPKRISKNNGMNHFDSEPSEKRVEIGLKVMDWFEMAQLLIENGWKYDNINKEWTLEEIEESVLEYMTRNELDRLREPVLYCVRAIENPGGNKVWISKNRNWSNICYGNHYQMHSVEEAEKALEDFRKNHSAGSRCRDYTVEILHLNSEDICASTSSPIEREKKNDIFYCARAKQISENRKIWIGFDPYARGCCYNQTFYDNTRPEAIRDEYKFTSIDEARKAIEQFLANSKQINNLCNFTVEELIFNQENPKESTSEPLKEPVLIYKFKVGDKVKLKNNLGFDSSKSKCFDGGLADWGSKKNFKRIKEVIRLDLENNLHDYKLENYSWYQEEWLELANEIETEEPKTVKPEKFQVNDKVKITNIRSHKVRDAFHEICKYLNEIVTIREVFNDNSEDYQVQTENNDWFYTYHDEVELVKEVPEESFKIGDKVRIIIPPSISEDHESFIIENTPSNENPNYLLSMDDFFGTETVIEEQNKIHKERFTVENNGYWWHKNWLELIKDDAEKEKSTGQSAADLMRARIKALKAKF